MAGHSEDPQAGGGGCWLAAGSPRGRPACVAPGRRLPPSHPADGFQMTAPSREAPVPPQAAAPACFLPLLPPCPPRPRPTDGLGKAPQSRRRCWQQAGTAVGRALASHSQQAVGPERYPLSKAHHCGGLASSPTPHFLPKEQSDRILAAALLRGGGEPAGQQLGQ